MKAAQKMKVGKNKKTVEAQNPKKGAKLKKLRTSETNAEQKESNGKVVKSKMNIKH